MTRGAPTDSTRATIKVMGLSQTNAILSSCTACSGVALRNVQVDGSRPLLGFISSSLGGSALLEMGGSNSGQIIDNVNAFGELGAGGQGKDLVPADISRQNLAPGRLCTQWKERPTAARAC